MRTENKVIDPLSPYSRALKKIEESGIRATKQRRILAKLIFEKGDRHISAENLLPHQFDQVLSEAGNKGCPLFSCVLFYRWF